MLRMKLLTLELDPVDICDAVDEKYACSFL